MNMNWYKSIIAWFAENHVAANLLMVLLLLGGFYTALTIKKEIQPTVETNVISVSVPYLGAAPEDVEEGVCIKVEEAVQAIQGLEEITCTAREGLGRLSLEVNPDYDVDTVMDEVKVRIDGIATFPELTETPVVSRQQFEQPVMWISVFGDVDERTLKEFAQTARDEIVALPGVTRAEVLGGRPYEISIEVSEVGLEKYNLTFDEVANAVRRNSLDLPGGSIDTRGGSILLRTAGQAYRGQDFAQIVVRTNPDGSKVFLSDVTNVEDGFAEIPRYAQHNGQESIAIRVLSVGSQSELKISEAVRKYVAEKQKSLPAGIGIEHWADVSFYLKDRLDMMLENLAGGALLVFAILALFLRFKLAFWVMVGLPVAFLGAMFLMPTVGVSVNMLSLFGFILVLGIVVDDAIVIGESAYTSIRRDGHSKESVISGVLDVAMPATFGVLTTAAAFLPILMVGGVSGAFFEAIGWVVILCLAFSIVESKLILPAHLVHMKLKRYRDMQEPSNSFQGLSRKLVGFQRWFSEGLRHFVRDRYKPVLEKALEYRYTTLSLFLAGLLLITTLLATSFVRVVFFPDFSADYLQAQLEMNEGTPPEETERIMNWLQQSLMAVDAEVSRANGLEPGSVVDTSYAFLNSDTSGQMIVELVKGEAAVAEAEEIEDLWRDKIGVIPGARQLSFQGVGGPGGGPSIAFQLVGDDVEQLGEAAARLEAKVREFDGVYDIRNSIEGGARELKLDLRPEAQVLGLSLQDLARQVRQGFYGEEVQRIQRGADEVKVMVRYPESERASIGNLENMRVRTPSGESVPFSSVAKVEYVQSPTVIRRFDRQRAVSVTGEVDKDRIDPGPINREIRNDFLPQLLQDFPTVEARIDGGSAEQQRVGSALLTGTLLALFLIYALMAIPLKSYAQPLLIMAVIPFGVTGAIAGHIILDLPVSMLSFFGIIALSGVVVNDSLILVDFVNRARRKGLPLKHAVMEGAQSRFRAILLTSLTTFLGLVPIVFFETSLQAQIVIPMAASLAFGILFATVITLFLIPVLYHILDDIKGVFGLNRRAKDAEGVIEDPVSGPHAAAGRVHSG